MSEAPIHVFIIPAGTPSTELLMTQTVVSLTRAKRISLSSLSNSAGRKRFIKVFINSKGDTSLSQTRIFSSEKNQSFFIGGTSLR